MRLGVSSSSEDGPRLKSQRDKSIPYLASNSTKEQADANSQIHPTDHRPVSEHSKLFRRYGQPGGRYFHRPFCFPFPDSGGPLTLEFERGFGRYPNPLNDQDIVFLATDLESIAADVFFGKLLQTQRLLSRYSRIEPRQTIRGGKSLKNPKKDSDLPLGALAHLQELQREHAAIVGRMKIDRDGQKEARKEVKSLEKVFREHNKNLKSTEEMMERICGQYKETQWLEGLCEEDLKKLDDGLDQSLVV